MSSPEETFQNECLRPLLKNQHDWLIAAFVHYLEKHKIAFGHLTSEEKFLNIDKIIKKDLSFRHSLIGLIVGNMRFEDFETYLKSETAFNKRLVSMIVKEFHLIIKYLYQQTLEFFRIKISEQINSKL